MPVRFFLLRGALIAAAVLLLVPAHRSLAQEAASEPDDGGRKLPIESVAPYSSWTHHAAGKPEEAVVPVRFADAGADSRSIVTGLMIRCDGFVLVPRGVRDVARNGGAVDVLLSRVDGADSAKAAVTPIAVGARAQPYTNAAIPYAVVKINNYHAPSLPLLDSANVRVGTPIRVLWFTAGPRGTASELQARQGVTGAATAARDTFAILPAIPSGDAAEKKEPVPPIPSGAIVVDAESGAAVGMVLQGGATPTFITLARFGVISSEVAPAPDRAAVRLGDRPGILPPGLTGMVWVPGGPVALDGKTGGDFKRDYNTTVACTPGFWIAAQPVTNGLYREWLRGKGRPLPYGWTDADLTAPRRRADMPACGMLPEDAQAFAAAFRSRLPTEVEWARAAYSRDTTWVEEINDNWDSTGLEMEQMAIILNKSIAVSAANRARMAAREGRRERGLGNGTGNDVTPVTPEMIAIADGLRQRANELLRDQWLWGQVTPVDAFQQDSSIFGVRNVLINAPEMVNSRLHATLFAPKKYPATVDPDLTQFSWSGSGIEENQMSLTRGRNGEDVSFTGIVRRIFLDSFLIRFWRKNNYRVMENMIFLEGNVPILLSLQGEIRKHIYAGFRCAR